MKTDLPKIGVDPGVSNGGISVLSNGKLHKYKMQESFRGIREIFKPFAGSPDDSRVRCSVEKLNIRPNQNPHINARMQPMYRNYERIQDALIDCNIPFQLVSPVTWQKFNNLILPKGIYEKGFDNDKFETHKKELRHLKIHLSIESKTPNDEVIVDDIRYILETSGKPSARKALADEFAHFSKYDLNKAIKEAECDIDKLKKKKDQLRKKRYQSTLISKLEKEGYNEKMPLWATDSTWLLLYEIHN